MYKKFTNFFIIIISLIFFELISQTIVLKYEKKYSILIKKFINIETTLAGASFETKWNSSTNKMMPGNYKNEFTEYFINSKGFRGKEFERKKDKIRIITFGGSTTLGLKSPEDKTYPSQLEALLNSNNKNYEVINMGFLSKSLKFIKNLYFTEAYKYDPDIIVIFSNRNSIMYDGSSIEPSFESSKFLLINYFLQDNIMTYRLLWKTYKVFLNKNLEDKFLKSPFQKKGVSEIYLTEGFKKSLNEIINFSLNKRTKVIIMKQAYNFQPNIIDELNKFSIPELIKLYKEDFFTKKYKISEEANFWTVIGTIINKNIDELALNNSNFIVVDPVDALLLNPEINFTDYVHLSPEGNLILAETVLRGIKELN